MIKLTTENTQKAVAKCKQLKTACQIYQRQIICRLFVK